MVRSHTLCIKLPIIFHTLDRANAQAPLLPASHREALDS
ncbi:hypothetical protein [Sporisorium scitamineum]|uniref:Uncharacterized protein n=1 Tax=Sporisorium scitamineum TaxID=49012 RepID=A0A0F7S0I1_9BASI|nr:hypothetical protein [Sporisorium scitamineum]